MKLSKGKIIFLSLVVMALALGVAAFTPFNGLSQTRGEDDGDPPLPEPMQALADALGVTVEELQAAYQAASQTLLQQSLDEALEKGLITQERADEILDGEGRFGRRVRFGPGFGGQELDELAAAELGVPVEEIQAARASLFSERIEQAVADGDMTQTAADLALARQTAGSYFEQAWASAYQDAVQAALDDGAIDQVQADLLLENRDAGFHAGFGFKPFGGRGGHRPPHGEPPAGASEE